MFQPLPLFVGLRYSLAREHSFFVSFITWASLSGVAVGVAALITILSVMNGFESELRTRLLSLAAHATLSADGAAINDWTGDIRRLKASRGVLGAAPFLDVDAMLSHAPAMSGAIVRGIDPALEGSVSSIGDSMRQGKISDLVAGSNRVVLGRMLAYQLEVGVGDSVTVMIPARSGAQGAIEPRLQEFEVSGIFEVGLQDHDSVLALVNLQDAENFKGLTGPTGIRLRFNDVLDAPRLARAAEAASPTLKARDWTEENAAYFRAIRIEKSMMGLILLLIVAVAVFNIVATLVMVVNDKRTDIAILRTLGLAPRGVLLTFMSQGLLIGWAGTILGVIMGLSLSLNVDVIVPFLESTFGFHIMDPDVYYISGIPSETHPQDVLLIAAAALLLTLLATIYPSLRAARTPPPRRCGTNEIVGFENLQADAASITAERSLVSGFWYEGFIGQRYLRAGSRRGFLSLIGTIALLGLALGVAVLIVVLSVMNGFEEELRTRILSLTAHATVSGLEGRIDDWHGDLDRAAHFSGVVGASPYIEEQGMAIAGERSAGVLMRGIDPAMESKVADLSKHLTAGKIQDLTTGSYRIILGDALAQELHAKVGDRIVMIISQGNVTPIGVLPRMRSFTVTGIIAVGMYDYDRRIAIMNIGDAQKLLRMGGAITGIRLAVGDIYAAPRVVHGLAVALGGGFYVEDWTGRHANFFRSIEITKRILFVILSLMVAVAAFNIVSTMVMVVKDKRRDIAILRTLGASPSSILSIFIVQGSLIGVLGVLAGLALGSLVAVNLQSLVHGLEAVIGFKFLDAKVYFMSDLPAHLHAADLVRICAVAFALACASTIYPAFRAARMQPAAALRND